MNIYARVIVEEAERRGIAVHWIDEERQLFRLEHGGISVLCHESLTDRTSAVTYEICSDKHLTQEFLRRGGLPVPRQVLYRDRKGALRCLDEWGRLVVKPLVGEQGRGITVDISDAKTLEEAVRAAREWDDQVLLEEYVEGRDLRIIVIDHRYVAAIERIPATVVGDGEGTVAELVARRNQELDEETGGESRIPEDAETRRCVGLAGYRWESVLPQGEELPVRKTANYHTGGRIVDVTEEVSGAIRKTAEEASRILNIPVVGFDLLTPDFGGDRGYVFIEANERPGLANHEPQPVPERFLDFLFPETVGKGP